MIQLIQIIQKMKLQKNKNYTQKQNGKNMNAYILDYDILAEHKLSVNEFIFILSHYRDDGEGAWSP